MGGFGGTFGDFMGVDPEEDRLRREQEAALQEHAAYAKNLQEMQDQVAVRGEDLDITKQLLQATSPQIPKGVREFLLRGISSNVGVDPKGEYSQNLIKMMSGLDPQSLEAMRASFGGEIPNAAPGQIKQQIRAVFTGQIPVSQLVQKVAQRQVQTPPGMAVSEPQPSIPPGTQGPSPPGRSVEEIIKPSAAEQRAGNVRRLPSIGETAPRDQPTEPALLHELGLDPTQKARNDDVIQKFPGIPTDPKEQRDLVKKLQEQNANSFTAVQSAIQLHDLFRGRPETLGVVGGVIRTVDETIDQLNAAGKGIGAVLDLGAPGIRKALDNSVSNISKLYKDSGFEQTAVDSARIKSLTLQMAYDMAIARGIPGNRLTNSIIGQQIVTLGNSPSVAQFEGVLKDVTKRALDEGSTRVGVTLGSREYYPNLRNASDEDLQNLVRYSVESKDKGVIPDRYKTKVIEEMELRAKEGEALQKGEALPSNTQKLKLSSPTIEEEESSRRESLVREETRKRQETASKITGEERAQATAERAQREEVRKTDLEQTRQKEADRRYELQLKKEERAATQERRAAIIKAFSNLGAAIAGSRSGNSAPGGGISAPEQDSSAFRLAPPAQRRPPTPVDAGRYQRGNK